jgi:hypothetical protein
LIVKGTKLADWQFYVLAGLLVWNLWRTRTVAQTSPWLRDALLRRIFEQLNRIEARQKDVPLTEFEQETQRWWGNEIGREAGRPKGWPWPWAARPTCGPWCHSDWQTRGVGRLDEIKYESTRTQQKAEEERKDTFEKTKLLAEGPEHLAGPRRLNYMYELGFFYDFGRGVARDRNEALRWYHKAAKLGDQGAQWMLARAYFDGDGVAVDHTTAYFWLKLMQMHDGVHAVGDILSPEQRSEVDQLCRKWMESHRVRQAEPKKGRL